jgi:hypothetical protein
MPECRVCLWVLKGSNSAPYEEWMIYVYIVAIKELFRTLLATILGIPFIIITRITPSYVRGTEQSIPRAKSERVALHRAGTVWGLGRSLHDGPMGL